MQQALPIFSKSEQAGPQWSSLRQDDPRSSPSRDWRGCAGQQDPRGVEAESSQGRSMGIVRFALRFPHTFYVMALAMLFLGISAILTSPKDIFPTIDIPVVTVIWQYTGLT